MRNIDELLFDGLVVAEVDAHPDDYVQHANAHHKTNRRKGIKKHNVTLTLGEGTTKNYHPSPKFKPAKGHREAEGRRGAERMGFDSYKQLAGVDRELARGRSWLAPHIAQLFIENEVDLVLATNQVTPEDSPDHATAALIALEAAHIAHKRTSRSIGVLTLQSRGQGDWVAEATPDSMLLAHQAAEDNPSQFRYADVQEQPDWPVVSSGRALHPDDLRELLQYPIQEDAGYTFIQVGGLAVPQPAGLAVAGTR